MALFLVIIIILSCWRVCFYRRRHTRSRTGPLLWGLTLWGEHPIYRFEQWPDAYHGIAARRRGTEHPGESRRIRHESMKQKLNGLSRRYLKVLRKHLKQGPRASLQPAVDLGRRAVVLGLDTLELARMHEQ